MYHNKSKQNYSVCVIYFVIKYGNVNNSQNFLQKKVSLNLNMKGIR